MKFVINYTTFINEHGVMDVERIIINNYNKSKKTLKIIVKNTNDYKKYFI
jgi:hypothetical protein